MPSSRNFVVGLFLIVGTVLFAVGLFMIGDRRKLFSHDFEVYAEFKELSGLQNGADVKVGGMAACEVTWATGQRSSPASPSMRSINPANPN